MSRTETTLVGLIIAIICPASLLVLCWWAAATLSLYQLVTISESGIVMAALTGLGMGIIVDIFYLKKWTAKFYQIKTQLMILPYLFWSAIAVAFFMGLPLGNIILGVGAGLYVGRRQHHAGHTTEGFAKATRNVSLFTAAVTGLEALPIGLLGLKEGAAGLLLKSIAGLDQSVTAGSLGVALIIALCLVLMAVQFWCTRTAARFAFRLGRNVF